METVFDHNLTPDEVEELGVLDSLLCIRHGVEFPDPLTPEGYQANITPTGALFDLGLLFDIRQDIATRDRYWSFVPDLAQQYLLGLDYVLISSEDMLSSRS